MPVPCLRSRVRHGRKEREDLFSRGNTVFSYTISIACAYTPSSVFLSAITPAGSKGIISACLLGQAPLTWDSPHTTRRATRLFGVSSVQRYTKFFRESSDSVRILSCICFRICLDFTANKFYVILFSLFEALFTIFTLFVLANRPLFAATKQCKSAQKYLSTKLE